MHFFVQFKKIVAFHLLLCISVSFLDLLPLKHIKNLEHFMETCKDINLDSEGKLVFLLFSKEILMLVLYYSIFVHQFFHIFLVYVSCTCIC